MFVPSEPGQQRVVASWEQPFDMLRACHDRVHRMLTLLGKLQAHVVVHGVDAQARQAARDVMRYFDQAAPLHHQDEELHIFPAAHRSGNPDAIAAVIRLGVEHQTMEADWRHLRAELQALLAEETSQPLPLAWQTDQLVQAFCARYAEHIRIEEQLVYPCVERLLTPDDAQTMGSEMAARRGAGLRPPAF
ncbi:hemerythrin domain-containing protein [Rhodoferax sp. AJA081-3]|uniref:hemerythrin domain-containing protein n=1 Tax=Rhodoferax sp. AJA081-3 TaxID=2752316 RepID=UPI001AE0AB5B|nr:hemerythrin domain-containing protein [Rhodoferax sp. AJA081-3]QTN30026.1 hemerythrin domain-containing protein [Rhodoferax sp. AJA081-3]